MNCGMTRRTGNAIAEVDKCNGVDAVHAERLADGRQAVRCVVFVRCQGNGRNGDDAEGEGCCDCRFELHDVLQCVFMLGTDGCQRRRWIAMCVLLSDHSMSENTSYLIDRPKIAADLNDLLSTQIKIRPTARVGRNRKWTNSVGRIIAGGTDICSSRRADYDRLRLVQTDDGQHCCGIGPVVPGVQPGKAKHERRCKEDNSDRKVDGKMEAVR